MPCGLSTSFVGMGRSEAEERLDIEVATRLFGFRWVEWNQRALGGSPLYTPGRFLAPPDYPLSHMLEEAATTSPLHAHATAKVPEYSSDETCAHLAAERAGLFSVGKAVVSRADDGSWVVDVQGRRLTAPRLPEVICRASLDWAGATRDEGR